jgi:Protein of unknown function (DUF2793)
MPNTPIETLSIEASPTLAQEILIVTGKRLSLTTLRALLIAGVSAPNVLLSVGDVNSTLTSTATDKPLAASAGKTLKDALDALPGTAPPLAPTAISAIGTGGKFSREDHQHPRQSAVETATTVPVAARIRLVGDVTVQAQLDRFDALAAKESDRAALDSRVSAIEGKGLASAPVLSQLNAIPGSVAIGDRFLIGPAPTGVWAGAANQVAQVTSTGPIVWAYSVPFSGMTIFVKGAALAGTTGVEVTFNGTAWEESQSSVVNALTVNDPNSALSAAQGPVIAGLISTEKARTDRRMPIISSTLTVAPPSPALGDRYVVAASATLAWATKDNNIAQWDGAAWVFTVPVSGDEVYDKAQKVPLYFDGTLWGRGGGNVTATTNKGLKSTPGTSGTAVEMDFANMEAAPALLDTANDLITVFDASANKITKVPIFQIATPVASLADSVIGTSDNGTGANSVTTSLIYVDIPNAVINVTLLGEYSVELDRLQVNHSVAGSAVWVAITDALNTVIAEVKFTSATALSPVAVNVSTPSYTVTGPVTLKARYRVDTAGAGSITNSNLSGSLRPRIAARRVSGFAALPGTVSQVSGRAALASNQTTPAVAAYIDSGLQFVAPESGTFDIEYEAVVSNAAAGGSVDTCITDSGNNPQPDSIKRTQIATANNTFVATGSCRMTLAAGDLVKMRFAPGGANTATLYGNPVQGYSILKWSKSSGYVAGPTSPHTYPSTGIITAIGSTINVGQVNRIDTTAFATAGGLTINGPASGADGDWFGVLDWGNTFDGNNKNVVINFGVGQTFEGAAQSLTLSSRGENAHFIRSGGTWRLKSSRTPQVLVLTGTKLSGVLGGITWTHSLADPWSLTTSIGLIGTTIAQVLQFASGVAFDYWVTATAGPTGVLMRGKNWGGTTSGSIGIVSASYCSTMSGVLTGNGRVFRLTATSTGSTGTLVIEMIS